MVEEIDSCYIVSMMKIKMSSERIEELIETHDALYGLIRKLIAKSFVDGQADWSVLETLRRVERLKRDLASYIRRVV